MLIGRWMLVALLANAIFLGSSIGSKCCPHREPTSMKINIFAEADWYRARPEPEKVWQGVLQERSVPVGPNTRTGLNYTLVTEREQFPVYAVNVEPQLVPFLGRQVRVHGKLVNLSNEGFGKELWISSIRCY